MLCWVKISDRIWLLIWYMMRLMMRMVMMLIMIMMMIMVLVMMMMIMMIRFDGYWKWLIDRSCSAYESFIVAFTQTASYPINSRFCTASATQVRLYNALIFFIILGSCCSYQDDWWWNYRLDLYMYSCRRMGVLTMMITTICRHMYMYVSMYVYICMY